MYKRKTISNYEKTFWGEKRKLTCQEKYHQDSYTKTKEYKEKNNITWKNKSEEELKI